MNRVSKIIFYSKLIKLFEVSGEGWLNEQPSHGMLGVFSSQWKKKNARLKAKVGNETSRSTLRNYTEKQEVTMERSKSCNSILVLLGSNFSYTSESLKVENTLNIWSSKTKSTTKRCLWVPYVHIFQMHPGVVIPPLL